MEEASVQTKKRQASTPMEEYSDATWDGPCKACGVKIFAALVPRVGVKGVPMKQNDIVKVIAQEFGTSDIKEINKRLKAEPGTKFRITGKAVGHFGFTGELKSLTEEGVKVFMTNKVSLIRYSDIEGFEKAKPRVERPVRTAKPEAEVVGPKKGAKKAKASVKDLDEDFEDEDDEDDGAFDDDSFDDEELRPKKLKKSKAKPKGKSGSKFIPAFKK